MLADHGPQALSTRGAAGFLKWIRWDVESSIAASRSSYERSRETISRSGTDNQQISRHVIAGDCPPSRRVLRPFPREGNDFLDCALAPRRQPSGGAAGDLDSEQDTTPRRDFFLFDDDADETRDSDQSRNRFCAETSIRL
jgi:hypothetical protein